jgi:hypothetical protein
MNTGKPSLDTGVATSALKKQGTKLRDSPRTGSASWIASWEDALLRGWFSVRGAIGYALAIPTDSSSLCSSGGVSSFECGNSHEPHSAILLQAFVLY